MEIIQTSLFLLLRFKLVLKFKYLTSYIHFCSQCIFECKLELKL